jgi:Flp pilus assembly pilin Flp
MLRRLYRDECGAVVSAELALVLTIVVNGLIVGLNEIAVSLNQELNDVSNALGTLDQSFGYTGYQAAGTKLKSFAAGTTFIDAADECDTNVNCDLVVGVSTTKTNEGSVTP